MNQYNDYTHIATATTTTVLAIQGILKKVILNEPTTGTITIYDNTAGSGDIVAIIASSTAAQELDYNLVVKTGITIVTAGADDITVTHAV